MDLWSKSGISFDCLLVLSLSLRWYLVLSLYLRIVPILVSISVLVPLPVLVAKCLRAPVDDKTPELASLLLPSGGEKSKAGPLPFTLAYGGGGSQVLRCAWRAGASSPESQIRAPAQCCMEA